MVDIKKRPGGLFVKGNTVILTEEKPSEERLSEKVEEKIEKIEKVEELITEGVEEKERNVIAELEAEESMPKMEVSIDPETRMMKLKESEIKTATVDDSFIVMKSVRSQKAFNVVKGDGDKVPVVSIVARRTKRNMRVGDYVIHLEEGKRYEVPTVCLQHLKDHGFA